MGKYILLLSLFIVGACKTAKLPTRPMEQYEDRFAAKTSVVNIPVRIDVYDLESTVNQQLAGIVYEDKDFNDGDNMTIKATKRDRITIAIDSQMIKYRVPLSLNIKYDIGISKVEATGDIALNFKTSFNIKSNWALQTNTTVDGYDWLQKPRMRMAGVSLPIGFIADIVLKNSKQTLAKAIDEQVKEQLQLDVIVGDAWKKMFDPILVSPQYNTWLTVNPQSISMTPLKLDNNQITSTIVVESQPTIRIGAQPATPRPTSLPNFKYVGNALDDFELFLDTDIPFQEAEKLARAQLVGETFSQGNRSVKVEDIELYGQGNFLIVNTKLTGSYNGSIYLTGRPVFDNLHNTVKVEDIKFTLDTENFLYKSAGWLLKSTLRKKIQDNLQFLLDDNLKDIQQQLQEQLSNYTIAKGIQLKGQLQELNLQNAYLASDGIKVRIGLRGKADILVNQLN